MTTYNVQCVNGHVFQATKGSILEKRCVIHCEEGYLDALAIHSSECPECRIEELCCFSEAAAWEDEIGDY